MKGRWMVVLLDGRCRSQCVFEFGEALAEKLAHGDGYSRVRLQLTEPDMPVLSTLLSCPTSCPRELGPIPICSISGANLQPPLDALTLPRSSVRMLSVYISDDPGAKITALAQMLRSNRSIERICITIKSERDHFVQEVLDALEANKNISELEISSDATQMETVTALSEFFAHNRKITKLRLPIARMHFEEFREPLADSPFAATLSQGLAMNPVIVEFEGKVGREFSRSCYPIFEMLRSNRAALNRAADFVLLRDADAVSAQAFELFFNKPCLLEHVMEISGQTEGEAQLAIAIAHSFLLDNYFVITGVVEGSVVCYPADTGTQCDVLNAECWRAIFRHLKVSDVLW